VHILLHFADVRLNDKAKLDLLKSWGEMRAFITPSLPWRLVNKKTRMKD
jgi:hypothetical protein